MSKLLNYFKRISALILVCITISFSAFSSYASVPVQASGVLEVSIISSLIEALMASMGLSFSSTTDLNNVATGLDSMMSANPDYTYKGVKIFDVISEVLLAANLGQAIALPLVCIEWTQNWLYGISSSVMSDASDVYYKNPSVSVSGAQVIYGDFSREFFEANNLFYGLPVYYDSSNLINSWEDLPIYDCPMVVSVFNLEAGTFSLFYPYGTVILYPQALDAPTELGSQDGALINSVFKVYKSTGDEGYHYQCFLKGGESKFTLSNSYYGKKSTDDNGLISYKLNFLKNRNFLGININNYSSSNSFYLPASSTNASVRVFVNSGTRFYESYEEYKVTKLASAYEPSSSVYGSASASKELVADEAGTVSLQLTQAQLTETIEKAVADAIAANPSITEEELNEMVAEQVGALSGVQDSIEDNTEVLNSLSSIMTAILDTVKSISASITNFFVIDTAAIDVALAGFDTVWESKVPFASALTDMFNNFSFSEDYEYPVISMKTPDILKSFYAEDLIILCDFANYATYCVWCRNLVRALLWFSFAFSVVNHLKTDFHVG